MQGRVAGGRGRLAVITAVAVVVGLSVVPADPAAAGAPIPPPTFFQVYGNAPGSDQSQLDGPNSIALMDDVAYVAEVHNNRVSRIDHLSSPIGAAVPIPEAYGVAAADGFIYATSSGYNSVVRFDPNGSGNYAWGGPGTQNGQFSGPRGIAVAPSGNLYVVDRGNNRIQEFTPSGIFVRAWGSAGTGPGEFSLPEAVTVDRLGDVYVADSGNSRIQRFTATGTFVSEWGQTGAGPGQLSQPTGISADRVGNIFVADFGNDRVQQFTEDGAYVTMWTPGGTPAGVTATRTGTVYVTLWDQGRVETYDRERPDVSVRLAAGPFVGNDVYNGTGAGQARTGLAARGRSVTYTVRIQNDALAASAFEVRGSSSNARFVVRYDAGPANVTAAVGAGTYTTAVVGPGASTALRVTVTVRTSAPAGSVYAATIGATGPLDATRFDVVKFTTRRT